MEAVQVRVTTSPGPICSSAAPFPRHQWRVRRTLPSGWLHYITAQNALEEGLLIMITNVRFQGQATAWVNEGTQVATILDHLKQHSATLYNKILGI